MSVGRLESTLRAARDRGRKLLVPYVMGGMSDDWVDVLRAIAAAGADAIEVEIPFSDPAMDGPTVQEASNIALGRGATPVSILDDLRGVDAGVPLVAMTYYNIVARNGEARFAGMLSSAGICGAIIPDIPLEESESWESVAAAAGVETVLLVAPVTPEERVARIVERSHGFIYSVSRMGTTGERAELSTSAGMTAKRVKAVTDKPVLIGFGISTPEQAVEACAEADGVVVASALLRRMIDEGGGPEGAAAFIKTFRDALDQL
ncbi:MAG TPA: tryptophan synthase subunit alpha [Acidimicrobiales bacterium]|nr:tryptophan synthase subunit alpha [Acidimicrobiales bacterium]